MSTLTMQERLVAAGLDLFYKHGFHAVGLDSVLAEVNTTKTTFYKYFESKDALALACIQHRDARWRVKFPALLRERAGEDPIAQLREVFNLWQDWFSDIHFNGCLFIHACSEFPSPKEPCHIAARDNVVAIRAVIQGLAEEAGLINADEFTRRFSLLMQGSIVLEVIDRENTAASTAAGLAEVLIEHHLPTTHGLLGA
jgi:AcrR family transcriptional regulator